MAVWGPQPEDLHRVFDEQNPWQRTGQVAATLARPIERPLARLLWQRLEADEPHRCQLVLGPRRVGKTTALYQTVRNLTHAGIAPPRIWWLRLDHPLLLQASLADLVQAVLDSSNATEDQSVFLMLDELAYTERWDLWLKTFFDERWPVRIAATSSATAARRQRQPESGVGRWSEQHLTPYLFTEFLALVGQDRPIEVGDTLAGSLALLRQGRRADADLAVWRRLLMLVGRFPALLGPTRDRPDDDESSRLLRNPAGSP